jgi:hypothetical protein
MPNQFLEPSPSTHRIPLRGPRLSSAVAQVMDVRLRVSLPL